LSIAQRTLNVSRRHLCIPKRPTKRFPAAPKTLGDSIKVKRYERDLTLGDIARKLGVSVSVVKDWEDDRRRPDENARKALDRLLGLGIKPFRPKEVA
jgi:DNA-binding transcriptional regulator YiaG